MQTFRIATVEQLSQQAGEILKAIGPRRVVILDAPMGAGKTTLVSALANALGTPSIVNSPTFAIVNDYDVPSGESIYHFDLYRLKNTGEVFDIGFEDYINSGNYCFIEWPEVAEDLLTDDVCRITITVLEDDCREICVD